VNRRGGRVGGNWEALVERTGRWQWSAVAVAAHLQPAVAAKRALEARKKAVLLEQPLAAI